ncbi:MAG: tetratricopeptide repeat protein [Deltaproteobacteria bacterium]|nr:tetratricopeptide repeat protein [Deltaproteobacteria bacterium]
MHRFRIGGPVILLLSLIALAMSIGCGAARKASPPEDRNARGALDDGLRALESGQTDSALALFTEALDLEPTLAEAHYNRGLCRQKRNEQVLAVLDYTEAIRLRPDFSEALNNRGAARFEIGEVDLARDDWEAVLALHPDSAQVHFNLGRYYAEKRQWNRAVIQYGEALAQVSEFPRALNGRGIALLRAGRPEEALEDLNRAVGMDPSRSLYLYNRGVVHEALDEYAEALSDYTRAVELDPSLGPAYLNRGLLYQRLGSKDLGCMDLGQACELGLCDRYRQMQRMSECP